MPVNIGVSPYGITRSGALAVADAAVSGGFDTLWLGDGLLVVDDFPQWSGGMEPFTELAWLAGRYPSVRVGVGAAVLPLRDPLGLAKQASTLAHLAGGGAVLGISAGFWEREFTFRGLSFAARGSRFAELIGTLQAALAGEAHAGGVVPLPEGGRVSPIPPPGGVPIWLAGARATFERALQLGLPFQASRSSPDELAPLAREWFDRGGGTLAVRIRLTVEEAPSRTPGETVEWNTIAGSAEHALDQLQSYIELGVTDISIVPGQDDRVSLSTVETLGADVLPRLVRGRPAA
jgi:alkanesulfonate monooxygenase SsuD/methylene tetrahydromethanopterin reductase-like flavin-dependent oxidoreductase (luciferase family)